MHKEPKSIWWKLYFFFFLILNILSIPQLIQVIWNSPLDYVTILTVINTIIQFTAFVVLFDYIFNKRHFTQDQYQMIFYTYIVSLIVSFIVMALNTQSLLAQYPDQTEGFYIMFVVTILFALLIQFPLFRALSRLSKEKITPESSKK